MSTISKATARNTNAASEFLATAGAAVMRWWGAYIAWRMEEAAIAHLKSMSDRELKDIGLSRSQIEPSVRGDGESRETRGGPTSEPTIQEGATPMNVNMVYPPRPVRRGRVIALHCSGAGAGQWSYLTEALGGSYEVLAPEHYGCENSGPWTGERAFTLADEAARSIALIDQTEGNVHLVGHSYGGGVALNVALARPDRIASLSLYEPSAFHLLKEMGEPGAEGFAEITAIVRRVCEGVVTGDYQTAAAAFVNYWNGPCAWEAMRPSLRGALLRWMPKAPLDFRALIDEPTSAASYQKLRAPVLLLRGEHALLPSRLIAEGLSRLFPQNRLMVVVGAGHMGPLTHAPEVSALIVQHIAAAQAAERRSSWRPRQLADVLAVSRSAQVVS